MASLGDIAVVIPVAENDTAWSALLADLFFLPPSAEIHFVCPSPQKPAPTLSTAQSADGPKTHWHAAGPGRAVQLNAGARATQKPLLWFLHADSRFENESLSALGAALAAHPRALHYFDLRFAADGPPWMRINEAGAWFRSRALKMPFGDQGFCVSRELFFELGCFSEDAVFGEDHLFVWKARQAGIPVQSIGAPLQTSARKYRDCGWLSTTARHLTLTALQAIPQALRLARMRLARRG